MRAAWHGVSVSDDRARVDQTRWPWASRCGSSATRAARRARRPSTWRWSSTTGPPHGGHEIARGQHRAHAPRWSARADGVVARSPARSRRPTSGAHAVRRARRPVQRGDEPPVRDVAHPLGVSGPRTRPDHATHRGVRGFVDLHCHWVAAIDDGARTRRRGPGHAPRPPPGRLRRWSSPPPTCARGCSTTTAPRLERAFAAMQPNLSAAAVSLPRGAPGQRAFLRRRRLRPPGARRGPPLPRHRPRALHPRRSWSSSDTGAFPLRAAAPLLRPAPRRAAARPGSPGALRASVEGRRLPRPAARRGRAPPARRVLARGQVRARAPAGGREAPRGRRLRGGVLGRAQARDVDVVVPRPSNGSRRSSGPRRRSGCLGTGPGESCRVGCTPMRGRSS